MLVSSSSPERDPLSEEFSLSPALLLSLSHRRASEPKSPVVCWRIQSSVRPRAGLRARLARTVALTRAEDACKENEGDERRSSSSLPESSSLSMFWLSCWTSGKKGAGRRNGVWSARWWIGEPSEASLLSLDKRKCDVSDRGYGEPQLAVTKRFSSSSSSSDSAGEGVLNKAWTRSGRRGAGMAGREGDGPASAVDAVDQAGETGVLGEVGRPRLGEVYGRRGRGGRGGRKPLWSSCAGARGRGVKDGGEEDVVGGLRDV